MCVCVSDAIYGPGSRSLGAAALFMVILLVVAVIVLMASRSPIFFVCLNSHARKTMGMILYIYIYILMYTDVYIYIFFKWYVYMICIIYILCIYIYTHIIRPWTLLYSCGFCPRLDAILPSRAGFRGRCAIVWVRRCRPRKAVQSLLKLLMNNNEQFLLIEL